MNYDVFNGDADGICALLQLRLAQPKPAQLVTGVKRDIQLLQKISAHAGDSITVLDISFAKNHSSVQKLLASGASIFYVDHHQTGDIPEHPKLKTLLNTDANICTSLLMDQFLEGQFRLWAIVGAFGDNLLTSAQTSAKTLGLSESQQKQLLQLGTYLNYNAYGETVADLHFAPEYLFQNLVQFASPFSFIQENAPLFEQLQSSYQSDLALASQITPKCVTQEIYVVVLPDQAWARRVSGVYSNLLANQNPQRAHAILSPISENAYQVSVRAALTDKQGADRFCAQFETGGGRAAAGGINSLPMEQLGYFISSMETFFPAKASFL